jgi:hypothetical protein
MRSFQPHLEILPPPQQNLWPDLACIPRHFVLYGGTALALRLAHRTSVDFDFFTSLSFEPETLLNELPVLRGSKILQNAKETLTVQLNRGGEIKLSFFGGLPLGRVGEPENTSDGVLLVASLLDLAGTKAAVITQRAESKDYVDLLAMARAGIGLPQAIAAASSIYGAQYNAAITVKSLTYFGDGDLHKLNAQQRAELVSLASTQDFSLPNLPRLSDRLAPDAT